jgi:hypothetical protein
MVPQVGKNPYPTSPDGWQSKMQVHKKYCVHLPSGCMYKVYAKQVTLVFRLEPHSKMQIFQPPIPPPKKFLKSELFS